MIKVIPSIYTAYNVKKDSQEFLVKKNLLILNREPSQIQMIRLDLFFFCFVIWMIELTTPFSYQMCFKGILSWFCAFFG